MGYKTTDRRWQKERQTEGGMIRDTEDLNKKRHDGKEWTQHDRTHLR